MSGVDQSFDSDDTAGDPPAVKISSEVMVAAVVFLFMVVVFVFFLYLYAKYYLRPSHGRRSRGRFVFAAADLATAPRRGLDLAVLRSLPVTVYRAADFKEEGLECAVCLSELADGEEARLLPKCNHGFHLECIDMWFHSHSTCPLCRTPVVGEKLSPAKEAPATRADAAAEDSPAAAFPTNVLVWGGQDRVRSQEGPSSSATALTIEIPRSGMEGFPSPCSPLPSSRMPAEDAKSPASARFGPLRRLWSMGKRTPGASSTPREGDIEQGLGGGAPKSPANYP